MFVMVTSFYQSFRNMSILLPDLFLICEKYYTLSRRKISKIDRKQRRQIDEKKLAQGMKLE